MRYAIVDFILVIALIASIFLIGAISWRSLGECTYYKGEISYCGNTRQ